MRLKPSIPLELLISPLLIFFSVKFFLLGLEKKEVVIILVALLLFLGAFGIIFWINRNFRTIDIGGTIKIKGYFWGKVELDLKEINAYKLLEIRGTKYAVQDYKLVLYDRDQNMKLEITQGNYKTKDWDNFIKALTTLNIQFRGQESLVAQWRDQWIAFKRRLVK